MPPLAPSYIETPVFEDLFPCIDLSKWNLITKGGRLSNPYNGEKQLYQPQTLSIPSPGTLRIKPIKQTLTYNSPVDGVQTLDYLSGVLHCRQTFRYGFFEIEAKMPKTGAGIRPAFWMYGSLPWSDPNGRQEIDILEHPVRAGSFASDRQSFQMNVHEHDGAAATISYPKSHNAGVDLGDAYHVWGCEWEPLGVKFYFDGELVHTVDDGTPDDTMTMCVDYPLGGNWEGDVSTQLRDDIVAGASGCAMLVHRVTVWQKESY